MDDDGYIPKGDRHIIHHTKWDSFRSICNDQSGFSGALDGPSEPIEGFLTDKARSCSCVNDDFKGYSSNIAKGIARGGRSSLLDRDIECLGDESRFGCGYSFLDCGANQGAGLKELSLGDVDLLLTYGEPGVE